MSHTGIFLFCGVFCGFFVGHCRHKAKKIILFVSCNGLKKNRVGKFLHYFLGSKMCVLCMFYVDWELRG